MELDTHPRLDQAWATARSAQRRECLPHDDGTNRPVVQARLDTARATPAALIWMDHTRYEECVDPWAVTMRIHRQRDELRPARLAFRHVQENDRLLRSCARRRCRHRSRIEAPTRGGSQRRSRRPRDTAAQQPRCAGRRCRRSGTSACTPQTFRDQGESRLSRRFGQAPTLVSS